MHIALHIYSKNLFINYALPDKKYKDKEQRERENISNRRSDLKISRMNINLSWHGIKFSSKRRRVANERWIQGGGGGGGENIGVLAPSCLVQTSAWPKIIAIVGRR